MDIKRKEDILQNISGIEYMGDGFRDKLKYCGRNIRLYPLCKMIHAENAELDDNCQIFDYVFIDAGKSLKIGKFSTITWQALIEGGATTYIGDRVFIGPGTKILTSTYELHGYFSVEHLPEGCGAIHYGDITINDDAYIGASCTVMPGSIIGEGTVVGANSLVKGTLEPWGIYVGTPCKKIGEREKPTQERREQIEIIDWDRHFGRK